MKFLVSRCAAVLLLLAASESLVLAADTDPDGDVAHTDIRKELLSEFKYVKPQNAAPKAPSKPDTKADQPAVALASGDSAPLVMAPFTVRESADMDRLHEDLLMQKADARSEMTASKLGIGVHVARLGPAGFYAVTVFYVPIVVGFGFSW